MSTKVFIDTDIALGSQNADVDDAVAILLALCEPTLEIVGISPCSGNVPGIKSGPNLDALLVRSGKEDIPHASCAAASWDQSGWVQETRWNKQPKEDHPSVFGNGQSASEFLAQTVLHSEEPVTVITIGPLTNIATALASHSDCKTHIKEIRMMGGTWKMPGIQGQLKEFNMLCDPEAAHFVMQSGIPIVMFPLDVTKKRKVTPEDVQCWVDSDSPFLQKLGICCQNFMTYRAKRDGYDSPYAFFHDVMPIISLLHPSWFTLSPCDLQVDVDGAYTRGMTVIDFKKRTRPELRDSIAIDVDAEAVFHYVISKLSESYKARS